MNARERERLAAISDELLDGEATREGVAAIMLSTARQTGNYRYRAAEIIELLLSHPQEANADRLCALAIVVGFLTSEAGPGMTDMLRAVVPILARHLATQD